MLLLKMGRRLDPDYRTGAGLNRTIKKPQTVVVQGFIGSFRTA